jgi:biopolymer transport protein ExbD
VSLSSHYLKAPAFHRHLVARSHKAATRKRSMLIGLTLTSMVDMFSLLVIFLLQTFSSSPELLVIQKDVRLPSAITGKEIVDAPVLALSDSGVFLDQKRLGDLASILLHPEPLLEKLSDLRTQWQKAHPNQKFPGQINLQAHRDLPSTAVSQFMGMLPSQAYGSIQLAVISGGTATN